MLEEVKENYKKINKPARDIFAFGKGTLFPTTNNIENSYQKIIIMLNGIVSL